MRDLYHRKERLAYWINRTNADLQEPNKTDVGNSEGHIYITTIGSNIPDNSQFWRGR